MGRIIILVGLWLILTGSAVAQGNKQVQMIYARHPGTPDNYEASASIIRQVALGMDAIYDRSAHKTGGHRHIRFALNEAGQVDVQAVELPPPGTIPVLMAMVMTRLGYADPDHKYIIFVDASWNGGCAYATASPDDRPGADNLSNHMTGHAVLGRGCWEPIYAAHELTHLLGAVQHSAPNSTGTWHCTDEHDLMCHQDPPFYPPIRYVCPIAHGDLLDCNNDDYFHTSPQPGSYLADRWNVADSVYLTSDEMQTYLPMVMQ